MTGEFPFFNEVNKSNNGLTISGSVTEDESNKLIIELSGYLDTQNSSSFMKSVEETLNTNNLIKTVIIDLLKITYISSTGIGALSNILVQTKKSSQELYLSDVMGKVQSVMGSLGFLSFFNIIDTSEDI